MTAPPPPRPGGAHRAGPPPRGLVRSLLPSVIAVVAVGALLVVLLQFFGQSPGGSPTVAAPKATAPVSTPSVAGVASTSPPPVLATRTSPPVVTSTAPAAPVPVLVLNNSRVNGLAARAAADFRAAGWPIAGTGNYNGRIAETTAYYPAGGEAAARALAARFPKITRVLPRFPGLPGSGLTVVVTRDYTG